MINAKTLLTKLVHSFSEAEASKFLDGAPVRFQKLGGGQLRWTHRGLMNENGAIEPVSIGQIGKVILTIKDEEAKQMEKLPPVAPHLAKPTIKEGDRLPAAGDSRPDSSGLSSENSGSSSENNDSRQQNSDSRQQNSDLMTDSKTDSSPDKTDSSPDKTDLLKSI